MLYRLPLPVVFVLLWACYSIVGGIVFYTWSGTLSAWEIPAGAGIGLPVAGLYTVGLAKRRHLCGVEQLLMYRRALRTGVPPTPINVPEWSDRVLQGKKEMRSLLVTSPLLLPLCVLSLLRGHALFGAVLVLLFIVMIVSYRIGTARLNRLAANLQRQT